VTIDGQTYKKRSPLGVLLLCIVTFGIYYFYWYYQLNDELRRLERDESISPARSLMAVLFGWIIIVPPFIALYNTAQHIKAIERRRGLQPVIEPVLVVVFQLLLGIVNPPYVQSHQNEVLAGGSSVGAPALPERPA
jgi:uncharacterized protein DUF4234